MADHDVIGGLASLAAKVSTTRGASPNGVDDVLAALDEFSECVRYLNTRRSEGAVLKLDSEAAVQDAIYLILRPWVRDLVAETPTEKTANRFTIERENFQRTWLDPVKHPETMASATHVPLECGP